MIERYVSPLFKTNEHSNRPILFVIDFDRTTPESQEGISLEIRGGDRIFGLFADGWKCTNWSKGVFFTRTFKESF